MANRHTTAKAKQGDKELTVQQHETDSPLIPVAQLRELNEFKPEAVNWVIQQTQIEAEHRRIETHRINTFIFVEKLLGQVFALLIGLAGIGCGSYVALHGQPVAGGTIASLSLTGLAVVFVTGRKNK
jgi:uncharacterized membrane protein